jgi:hypothetical protein
VPVLRATNLLLFIQLSIVIARLWPSVRPLCHNCAQFAQQLANKKLELGAWQCGNRLRNVQADQY